MGGFKVPLTTKDKPLVDSSLLAAKDKPLVDPSQLAVFAKGAELPEVRATIEPPDFELLDNKRRITSFGMRFTARELAKLKYIASTTPDSMHEFCLKAIQKALENTK